MTTSSQIKPMSPGNPLPQPKPIPPAPASAQTPGVPQSPTIQGPRVLLMGVPGTGKTWSLGTLAKLGVRIFLIATEPSSVPAAIASFKAHGAPIDLLHYHQIVPKKGNLKALMDRAKRLQTMTYDSVTKMAAGPERSIDPQLMEFYETLDNFHDDRTGADFGNVGELGTNDALVIDSLSGLNRMVRHNFTGLKPSLAPGEWGVIMTHEHEIIQTLCASLESWFILISHLDREKDEITGGTTLYPAALGSKLGPKIPADFGEAIMCKRLPEGFFWSTAESNVGVVQRQLPVGSKLTPDFKLIADAYKDVLAQVKPD